MNNVLKMALICSMVFLPIGASAQQAQYMGNINIDTRRDGYTKVKPEYQKTDFAVRMVYYPSFDAVRDAYLATVTDDQVQQLVQLRAGYFPECA